MLRLEGYFEFDLADLDFGVHRIQNCMRALIERCVGDDLPAVIHQELQQGALAEPQKMLEELEKAPDEIQKS